MNYGDAEIAKRPSQAHDGSASRMRCSVSSCLLGTVIDAPGGQSVVGGDLETKGISPSFLIRNWPPAFKEWSTKSVRDAFFASPQFPRLTNPDVLKETISRGVGNGLLAYVGKTASAEYKPFYYSKALMTADVELSEEMFKIGRAHV